MKNAILLTVSILVSIAILEGGLRALTPFPIHDPSANRAYHEALGYTLSQSSPDADRRGFRNSRDIAAADTVDIVAIGDSHTYGFNVLEGASWPGYLSEMTAASVYNYGMGGYGILHYRYLFDEALKLKPKAILVGLYLINDLADYCRVAANDYWRPLLESDGLNYSVCRNLEGPAEGEIENTFRQRLTSTAFGSLLAYFKQRYFYSIGRQGTSFALGSQQTWTPDQRFVSIIRQTDTSRRRIFEARRAAFFYLQEMADAANAAEVDFGVLLIPSRERVLYRFFEKDSSMPPDWHRAVQSENDLVQEFADFFRSTEIPFIDGLSFIQNGLERNAGDGGAAYPPADGHPFRTGYEPYAEAALALLGQIGREPGTHAWYPPDD